MVITNHLGFAYGELENATPGEASDEINEAGDFSFTLPTGDPKIAICQVGREVQLWRGNQLRWWGPLVRVRIGGTEGEFQCQGLPWYFQKRHFGRANRVNFLTNGGFESGVAPWTTAGTGGTVTSSAVRALDGSLCLKVTGTTDLEGGIHAKQVWTHPGGGHPLGDLMTLSGWAYIPKAEWTRQGFDFRALWAEHLRAGKRVKWGFDPAGDYVNKFDSWQRMELAFENVMPGDQIDVRLYAPVGSIYYDLVRLVKMESLSFTEVDQADIIKEIVLYAQDRSVFRHGKSDLFIDPVCPLTGKKFTVDWQFADHDKIWDAIKDYTDSDNGVDVDVDWAQIGNRWTRSFRTHFPRQGAAHPELALELGRNIADFDWTHDGEDGASAVTILGSGDGPDREEGLASDPLAFNGVTLESVESAADGTDVAILNSLATDALRVSARPEILEVTVTGPTAFALGKGDLVPVRIVRGAWEINGEYRVVRRTIIPETDNVRVTLNRNITLEEAMARFPRAVSAAQRLAGGVWVVGSDGGVGAYGGAPFYGSAATIPLNAPMVAIVPHGSLGYWLVAADTGVFAYGDAPARFGHLPMINTEYFRGDRAAVAAAYQLVGDTLVIICDDGSTYVAAP